MKILIIEDQRRIADSLKKGLKQENFLTETAYDGVTGQKMWQEQKWNLILLDSMLPGVSGPDLLQKMRAHGDETPVIFLTAKSEVEDKVEGLSLGADDYITKPFDFTELLARITSVLRRQKQSAYTHTTLSCDTLEINLQTKQVTRGEKSINLSATEFRLLEYLMRHKDKVKSETEILENVWDEADFSLSNKVSVYMRYLRNKIDRPFPNQTPLIQTVRGMGYKISDTK